MIKYKCVRSKITTIMEIIAFWLLHMVKCNSCNYKKTILRGPRLAMILPLCSTLCPPAAEEGEVSSDLHTEQQYPPAGPSGLSSTGNKQQSYCECRRAGKTEIDGTVEKTSHKHTHTNKSTCWRAHTQSSRSCTVKMYS